MSFIFFPVEISPRTWFKGRCLHVQKKKSFPHGKIWNTLPLVDVGQVCPGLLAALGVSKGMPQAQSDVSMPGPWWVLVGSGQKISAHYSNPYSPSIS